MKFALLFAMLMLGACNTFQRSSQSGYSGDHPVTDSSGGLSSNNKSLHNMEGRLESRREKEQYSKILPWLTSDDEKMEFLSLPNVEARQAWINSHGIFKRAANPDPDFKEASETGDIAIGMQMDFVKKAWGDPQNVEVSGNALYKNERWRYLRFVSTSEGYKQEKRIVYFEGGRVVGWDTE